MGLAAHRLVVVTESKRLLGLIERYAAARVHSDRLYDTLAGGATRQRAEDKAAAIMAELVVGLEALLERLEKVT